MRYILYLFTMALLFVGGMMVGNIYLPPRAATLAASVSVPPLSQNNPVLQDTTPQTAQRNLNILNEALQSCPVVVNEEKDRLVNQIRLLLALEDFEIKKAQLELEIAKNTDTNRPTTQFVQAVSAYNEARETAEQLADELFPLPEPVAETQPENAADTTVSKQASTATATNAAAKTPAAKGEKPTATKQTATKATAPQTADTAAKTATTKTADAPAKADAQKTSDQQQKAPAAQAAEAPTQK